MTVDLDALVGTLEARCNHAEWDGTALDAAEAITSLRAALADAEAMNANYRQQVDALAGELARLREALEWYAEPVLAYAITQAREPRSAVHADGGARARATLEGKP
jgi:hypothetical protein